MAGLKKIDLNAGLDNIKAISFNPSESPVPPIPEPTVNAVDLGLSVKWGDRNIGADAPEEYGYYYAWGETQTKLTFGSATYTYSDSPEVLPSDHDIATVKLGSGWRMPTREEIQEMYNTKNDSNYIWVWKEVNGHEGLEVTYLINNNSVFFPAVGGFTPVFVEDNRVYWSSSSDSEYPNSSARTFSVRPSDFVRGSGSRIAGHTVRPIYAL